MKKNSKLKLLPASLLVVVVGSLLNQLFGSVGGPFDPRYAMLRYATEGTLVETGHPRHHYTDKVPR